MDISSMVNKAVEAFKKDDTLKAQFLSDPVKALEKVVYSQKVYDLIVSSGFTPVFEVPAE